MFLDTDLSPFVIILTSPYCRAEAREDMEDANDNGYDTYDSYDGHDGYDNMGDVQLKDVEPQQEVTSFAFCRACS
jgi:hypothetical protein